MTRRIIPHGPDAVLDPTVLMLGEVALAEGSARPRFGDGATPGGNVGAFLTDLDPLDERIQLVEGTVTSGRLGYATYADLSANTAAADGALAEVPITDTGTHVDPVSSAAVNNSGVFKKVTAGWQRLYDVDAAAAGAARDQAVIARNEAVAARDTAIAQVNFEQTIGRPQSNTPVTGTSTGANVYVFATPLSQAGQLYMLRAFAMAAGSIIISTWTKSGDTFTRTSATTIALAAGLNEIPLASLPVLNVAAGQYIGVSGLGIIGVTNAASGDSGGLYIGAYGASFSDATVDTTPRLEIGLTFGAISSQRFVYQRFAGVDARVDNVSPTGRTVIGKIGAPVTGSANPGRTFVIGTPAAAPCLLRSVRFWALAGGTIKIRKFTKSGDVFTQVGEDLAMAFAAASPGLVSLTISEPFHIAAGQYVGFYAGSTALVNAGDSESAGIGYYDNQAAGGGDATTFTDTAISYAVTLQIGFTFDAISSGSLLDNMLSWIEDAGNSGVDYDFPGVVPTGYIVVVVDAQSNGAGRALSLSPELFEPLQSLKYVRSTTGLATMADPTGNDTIALTGRGSFGPSLAKAIQRLSNGNIGVILVNSALGGTTIVPGYSQSAWASGGSARAQAATDFANAMSAAATLKLPVVGCCVVMDEGETAGDLGVGNPTYKTAFTDFQSWVGSTYGLSVPIIMVRIGTTTDAAPSPANYAVIRQAQDEIAEDNANVYMAHTGARYFLERGLMMDAYHYTIQGYREVGEALGNAIFSIALGKRPKGYHG